jgi:hypothetical protein
MDARRSISILISLLFLAASCTEIPPEINPQEEGPVEPGDTVTVVVQSRQVLIEEFTGVRCVNCPAGAATIERLIDQHEGRLIAVSIHAGFFARPYPESLYDFQTADGNNLQIYLGDPFGYPTAVVNRRLFDGEGDLQLSQASWAGYIQQEIDRSSRVYLGIGSRYDTLRRELAATVKIEVVEEISEEDVRLSLALTEDGIADRQLTPDGEQADYIHNHVLRDMITPYDGISLATPLLPGESRSEGFVFEIPETWQAANCHLVAFLHLAGEQKDVLQVIQAGIID